MRLILVAALLIFLASCGGGKKLSRVEKDTPSSTAYDESFDPATLNDDDIIIARNPKANTAAEAAVSADAKAESVGETRYREVNGFQVQIFVTKDLERATLVREEARELFADLGYAVYLTFESNLYKVRVGDAVSREEAETIKDEARDRNYREAFIVRAKVRVPVSEGN